MVCLVLWVPAAVFGWSKASGTTFLLHGRARPNDRRSINDELRNRNRQDASIRQPHRSCRDLRSASKAGQTGRSTGLTFAAKDLFDVAGQPTGGGNHDWARSHPVPDKHAWAVKTLLNAGATLIGKTITDEVSLGILGENAFDGTPLNPRHPIAYPVARRQDQRQQVASGLCDTALGH
jgi:Asp-tRNA(Asn)/Glu-tRNA(Gln) amidotransferase A subunit family amidase